MVNGNNLQLPRDADAFPARPGINDGSPESGDRTANAPRGRREGRAQPNVPQHPGTRNGSSQPRDAATPPTMGNRGRNTRASIQIATLNISGRGNLDPQHANNKWQALNQVLRDLKIGILALQESHLDAEMVERLHSIYGRRIRIHTSEAPHSVNAQGVAIVLNRELVNIRDVTVTNIIPGRAIFMRIKWHAERELKILNVYAPNAPSENTRFWGEIESSMARHNVGKPDLMLGDFNITEEAIDRLPARLDNENATSALRELTEEYEIVDGWRQTEPNTKDYSFPQRGSTNRSRLDRIYVTRDLLQSSTDWAIKTTGIPTDHRLVTAKISALQAPYIGRGEPNEWI